MHPSNKTDTIAAVATGTSAGGIGVVRISGPLSAAIAKKILGQCPAPRHATYLPFEDSQHNLIDQGIAIYYPSPNSYTGDDVLELQAHGGLAVLHLLLSQCLTLGARQAEPGEFTYRAFLNDKMDLAQAESVADLINATTKEAANSAARSLSGEFSTLINTLLAELISLRMFVEACLDFPEEEIDFITQGNVLEKLHKIIASVDSVFSKAKQGALLRDGIDVVLIGQPNVGKSSLLNALSGDELAIVTDIPGTTRDTIKTLIQIDGVPVNIIDTAGLRETEDTVEKFGIDRTWRATQSAHIALLLLDATHGIGKEELSIIDALPEQIHKVWIHNKIDLSQDKSRVSKREEEIHIHLSAKTGEGLDILKSKLLDFVGYQTFEEGVFTARSRHLEALAQVDQHLSSAVNNINAAELVAEELKLAQNALASITGEFTPDDLLGEIFSNFCIGK